MFTDVTHLEDGNSRNELLYKMNDVLHLLSKEEIAKPIEIAKCVECGGGVEGFVFAERRKTPLQLAHFGDKALLISLECKCGNIAQPGYHAFDTLEAKAAAVKAWNEGQEFLTRRKQLEEHLGGIPVKPELEDSIVGDVYE